jgi:hypothetical protein
VKRNGITPVPVFILRVPMEALTLHAKVAQKHRADYIREQGLSVFPVISGIVSNVRNLIQLYKNQCVYPANEIKMLNSCWGGNLKETISLDTRIERIKDHVRDLNRQIIFQGQCVERHAQQGLSFLDSGDEQMARAEAQIQLQAIQTRQCYVDVYTKFRLLLNEVERTQNLALCIENFQNASDVMKNVSLNIQNVDQMMVNLEQQLENVRDVSKSLQVSKIDNLRSVLTNAKTPLPLPDLPLGLTMNVADSKMVKLEL